MRRAWMIVGAATLALALGQVAASADWKTNAARKTVGNLARDGIEHAAKETAMDATLDAVGVPDGLLFAFVDKHVRRVAEAAARSAQ